MSGMVTVEVVGLKELSKSLKGISADAPKALREANNAGAQIVVTRTQSKFPKKSGRAARSVKASSTRTAVRVSEGGGRALYAPWLDYGGRVGRKRTTRRPIVRDGRYLYPSYHETRGEFQAALSGELNKVISSHGLKVE